jgi:hypothetical protein
LDGVLDWDAVEVAADVALGVEKRMIADMGIDLLSGLEDCEEVEMGEC